MTKTPGELLWSDWLEPLELTVGQAAGALGVSRKTLSAIINGGARITPAMSVRLAKALGTDADYWARLQLDHDMAEVDARRFKVRRLAPRGYAETTGGAR